MTHPILGPLIDQLPTNATSRKLIESSSDYMNISDQLAKEKNWCANPNSLDDKSKSGEFNLRVNGYKEWLQNAEEEDIIRMVGALQLLLETCSALQDDQDEEDYE